jgi:hypothetical protein
MVSHFRAIIIFAIVRNLDLKTSVRLYRQRLSVPHLDVTLLLGVSCVEEVQSVEKNNWVLSVVKPRQQVTEMLYMCPCSCLQGNCLVIFVILAIVPRVRPCHFSFLCFIKQNFPLS